MARVLRVLVALLAGLPLTAAPVPKNAEPPLYYPTRVGAQWLYVSGDWVVTDTVTAAKQKDRVWVVTVERLTKEGTVDFENEWEVSSEGLFQIAHNDKKHRNPECFLKLPAKPGEKWDVNPEVEYRAVATEPKRVKVPAGEFDAIGVKTYLGNRDKLPMTTWHAPGIGPVKIEGPKNEVMELEVVHPGQRLSVAVFDLPPQGWRSKSPRRQQPGHFFDLTSRDPSRTISIRQFSSRRCMSAPRSGAIIPFVPLLRDGPSD